jgi:hypothetical protein
LKDALPVLGLPQVGQLFLSGVLAFFGESVGFGLVRKGIDLTGMGGGSTSLGCPTERSMVWAHCGQ